MIYYLQINDQLHVADAMITRAIAYPTPSEQIQVRCYSSRIITPVVCKGEVTL